MKKWQSKVEYLFEIVFSEKNQKKLEKALKKANKDSKIGDNAY